MGNRAWGKRKLVVSNDKLTNLKDDDRTDEDQEICETDKSLKLREKEKRKRERKRVSMENPLFSFLYCL